MPTIYDKLPTLEHALLEVLAKFIREDEGTFHNWEIAVFLPAANAYIHYLDGVNFSLKKNNYLSAMANLRGLIECLGAVVYDGTAKLPQEAYTKFLKSGRLPKWDEDKNKWVGLGVGELVENAAKVLSKDIELKKVYNHCCDMLHFSAQHMPFLGGFNPQVDEDRKSSLLRLAHKIIYPSKNKLSSLICVLSLQMH